MATTNARDSNLRKPFDSTQRTAQNGGIDAVSDRQRDDRLPSFGIRGVHEPHVERFDPKEECWVPDDDATGPEASMPVNTAPDGQGVGAAAAESHSGSRAVPSIKAGSSVNNNTSITKVQVDCPYCQTMKVHAPHLLNKEHCTCKSRSSRRGGVDSCTTDSSTAPNVIRTGPCLEAQQAPWCPRYATNPRVPGNVSSTAGIGETAAPRASIENNVAGASLCARGFPLWVCSCDIMSDPVPWPCRVTDEEAVQGMRAAIQRRRRRIPAYTNEDTEFETRLIAACRNPESFKAFAAGGRQLIPVRTPGLPSHGVQGSSTPRILAGIDWVAEDSNVLPGIEWIADSDEEGRVDPGWPAPPPYSETWAVVEDTVVNNAHDEQSSRSTHPYTQLGTLAEFRKRRRLASDVDRPRQRLVSDGRASRTLDLLEQAYRTTQEHLAVSRESVQRLRAELDEARREQMELKRRLDEAE